ncbi:MAG: adenylate/guanylate cyclase domain-containing protein [Verrucomicrobia bacterium]|nr:adenylate/guanylate cyclase domain-containing protein [Verrucomicrobiota bacterium]
MPTTSMRVGIHTGALVSGSFGSSSRLEFTVLGDTVNTGARLEAAGKEIAEEGSTPDCVILMSDQTYSRLGGLFEAKLVGPMRLKGKGETVVVYRVLSEIKQEVASLSES